MAMKKICVVTGTRAEYGALKLLINKIYDSKKLDLLLLVTGMHLLEKYGSTINLIKEDGIPISNIITMYDETDISEDSLGKAVGNAISKFTTALVSLKPDLLLVTGDRFESLAGVIAASTLAIPIAHIHGGDNNERGQIDEQIRHSITKFAHIHFPATKKSYERIKLMGEEQDRIYNVGAIALDMIFQENFLPKNEICDILGLDTDKKIIVCLQHSYIFESKKTGEQMRLTLQILKKLNLQTVIIYPNNDPGSDLIIKEIESVRDSSNFKIFKNLERNIFLSLLKNADLLIGNSSSGLIESPVLKLPVVNIGYRNKGRESGKNVIHVNNDFEEIKNALIKGLSKEFKTECEQVINPYGKGTASEDIVEILENLELNENLLKKKLVYNV